MFLQLDLHSHQLNRYPRQQQHPPPHQQNLRLELPSNTSLNPTSLCLPLGTCLISTDVMHPYRESEVIPDTHLPCLLVITTVDKACHRLKGTLHRGSGPRLGHSATFFFFFFCISYASVLFRQSHRVILSGYPWGCKYSVRAREDKIIIIIIIKGILQNSFVYANLLLQ